MRWGKRERWHTPGDLAGDANRLTARRQDAQVETAAAQQQFEQLCARRDEVLAIVQNQQQLARFEVFHKPVD